MNPGDLVTATWDDGLQIAGAYIKNDRGYVVLLDLDTNKEVVCNPHCVTFVAGNHVRVEEAFSHTLLAVSLICIFLVGVASGWWMGL